MGSKNNETQGQLDYVQQILSGDENVCTRFVEEHTDWVLYKIYDLMKTHCQYSAFKRICCLRILMTERKGNGTSKDAGEQCDECMDSYLWCFDYLKSRLKSYKGINNCSLKTYVWSVINSRTMYVDWLRWKYGRGF